MSDKIVQDEVEFKKGDKVSVKDTGRQGIVERSHFRPDTPDNDLRKNVVVRHHIYQEKRVYHAEDLKKTE